MLKVSPKSPCAPFCAASPEDRISRRVFSSRFRVLIGIVHDATQLPQNMDSSRRGAIRSLTLEPRRAGRRAFRPAGELVVENSANQEVGNSLSVALSRCFLEAPVDRGMEGGQDGGPYLQCSARAGRREAANSTLTAPNQGPRMVQETLAQEYRSLARTHLDRAQALLKGSSDDLIFACLKLRQCIEALSYGLLVTYRHELSASAIMSWTPRKVLDELELVDPLANSSRTITVELPAADGASTPTVVLSDEDRRFSPKWANKAYNKLSNILHVPTPKTLEAHGELSPHDIREQCDEYAKHLETILASGICHFVSGRFLEYPCDCGFLIKRRVETVKIGTDLECSECGRQHQVVSINGQNIGALLREPTWTCRVCSTENKVSSHELEEGKEFKCSHCNTAITISKTWAFSNSK
jgi:hypothetical protein